MYNSRYMDPDFSAESLQRKVQFDIRLYFARRGCENMETMGKDHFKMIFDSKHETWYVIKSKDELTKNHRDIEGTISGIMPENKDDRLCPVRSYRMYLEHLNPANPYLWQYALDKVNPNQPDIWFGLQHIGKNPLSKFMSEVSKNCKLSKSYTNHSIRVTGITVLTRQQFSASEIMSISGHKSVQSLANYQRTQDKQKIQMGHALYQSMTHAEDQIDVRQLPPPAPTPAITYPVQPNIEVINKENVSEANAIVPFEADFTDQEVPDFDLMAILSDVTQERNKVSSPVKKNAIAVTTSNILNNVPKSMFSNCTIQNVTFNMPK